MAIVNRTKILTLALLLVAAPAMAGDKEHVGVNGDGGFDHGRGGGNTAAARHAAEVRAAEDNLAALRGIIDGIIGSGSSEGQPSGPCGCSPDRSDGQGDAAGF